MVIATEKMKLTKNIDLLRFFSNISSYIANNTNKTANICLKNAD